VIALKQRTDVDAKAKDRLLEVYLKDNDARVRNAAVITLASLGAPSEGFLTAVKQNSASNDAQTRKAANAALELLKKRRSASIGSQSSR
jgi:HEAT repeat protein